MTAPVSFTTDAFQALTRAGRGFHVKAVGGGFIGVLRPTATSPGHTTEALATYAEAVEELYAAHLVIGLVDKAMSESIHAQALQALFG